MRAFHSEESSLAFSGPALSGDLVQPHARMNKACHLQLQHKAEGKRIHCARSEIRNRQVGSVPESESLLTLDSRPTALQTQHPQDTKWLLLSQLSQLPARLARSAAELS